MMRQSVSECVRKSVCVCVRERERERDSNLSPCHSLLLTSSSCQSRFFLLVTHPRSIALPSLSHIAHRTPLSLIHRTPLSLTQESRLHGLSCRLLCVRHRRPCRRPLTDCAVRAVKSREPGSARQGVGGSARGRGAARPGYVGSRTWVLDPDRLVLALDLAVQDQERAPARVIRRAQREVPCPAPARIAPSLNRSPAHMHVRGNVISILSSFLSPISILPLSSSLCFFPSRTRPCVCMCAGGRACLCDGVCVCVPGLWLRLRACVCARVRVGAGGVWPCGERARRGGGAGAPLPRRAPRLHPRRGPRRRPRRRRRR